MYLSRVMQSATLGKMPVQASYSSHRKVWSWFGQDYSGPRDFLYRLDESPGRHCFYVLSRRRPDVERGWALESKLFEPKLSAGNLLAFSLRANPVKRRANGPGAGKRHDVVMDARRRIANDGKPTGSERAALIYEAGAQWLRERGAKTGFEVLDEGLRIDAYIQHRLSPGKGRRPIRFSSLDYAGLLRVAEPEVFLQHLYQGWGSAKGFGCGLMLLRRVRT